MPLQCVINHRKIIVSCEPPRSLISFVPIDLMAISETGGGAGRVGSIQAIDHKVNDLVYMVTTVAEQGTRGEIPSFKGLRRFPAAVLT